jgi:hypothetical protein
MIKSRSCTIDCGFFEMKKFWWEFSKNCVSFICEFTIFSFDLLDAIFKGDFAVSQGRRRHGAVYIPLTNCKIDLTSHL